MNKRFYECAAMENNDLNQRMQEVGGKLTQVNNGVAAVKEEEDLANAIKIMKGSKELP